MNKTPYDRIHALVARCLVDPAFFARVRATAAPGSNRPLAIDELTEKILLDDTDIERLTLFRGFITKIKHNSLRKSVPCTFRLLVELGVELDFFERFSPAYIDARTSGALTLAEHLTLFAEHLLNYASELSDDQRLWLTEVLCHEQTMVDLRMAKQEATSIQNVGIEWRGWFAMRRYTIDVVEMCRALSICSFDCSSPSVPHRHILAYWNAYESGAKSVFAIDELSACILAQIDGKRTVSEIAASFIKQGLREITPAVLDEFFLDASARGWVSCPPSNTNLERFAGRSSHYRLDAKNSLAS
jgi:hypothetical protein